MKNIFIKIGTALVIVPSTILAVSCSSNGSHNDIKKYKHDINDVKNFIMSQINNHNNLMSSKTELEIINSIKNTDNKNHSNIHKIIPNLKEIEVKNLKNTELNWRPKSLISGLTGAIIPIEIKISKLCESQLFILNVKSSDYSEKSSDEIDINIAKNNIIEALQMPDDNVFNSSADKNTIDNLFANTTTKDETTLSKTFPGLNDISNVNKEGAEVSWEVTKENIGENNQGAQYVVEMDITKNNSSETIRFEVNSNDYKSSLDSSSKNLESSVTEIEGILKTDDENIISSKSQDLIDKGISGSAVKNEKNLSQILGVNNISNIDFGEAEVSWEAGSPEIGVDNQGAKYPVNIKINNDDIEKNIEIEIESSDYKSQTDDAKAVSETIAEIKKELDIPNNGNIISTDNKTNIDQQIANAATKDETTLSNALSGVNDISSINKNGTDISWSVSKEEPGALSGSQFEIDLAVNKGNSSQNIKFNVNSSDYKESSNDQADVDALKNNILTTFNPTNPSIIPPLSTSIGIAEVKNNIDSTPIKDETTFNNAFPGLPSIANINKNPTGLGNISWNGIFPPSIPNNTFKAPITISQGNVTEEVEVEVKTSEFSPDDEEDVKLVWQDLKNILNIPQTNDFSSIYDYYKMTGHWIGHSFNGGKNNELTFNNVFPDLHDISTINIRGTKVYWHPTLVPGTQGGYVNTTIYITKGSQQKIINFKVKSSDYSQ